MGPSPAIGKLERIRSIIFDLDDTLYLQSHYKQSGFCAVAEWLRMHKDFQYNVTMLHLQNILDEHGPSYPAMFNRLCEQLRLGEHDVPQLVKVFLNHSPRISCFPGAKKVLRILGKTHTLGLLTDGRENIQRKKVRCLGLQDYFSLILYSDSMGLEKPAPALYEYFEDKLRLRAENLCYIGDNPNKDFVEAKRRGWLTIRLLTGEFKNDPASSQMEAHLKIDNIKQVLSLTEL